MANELNVGYTGALSTYVIARHRTDMKAWDPADAAWETYDAADWGDYDIPLADKGGGIHAADIPAGIAAGTPLILTFFEQQGASPATDDFRLRGPVAATWTGSTLSAGDATEAKQDTIIAALSGSFTVTVTDPVADDGDVTIVQGDDYDEANDSYGLTFTFTSYDGPDLSTATAELRLMTTAEYERGDGEAVLEVAATSVDHTDTTVTVVVELTAAQTAALEAKPPLNLDHYTYQLVATAATRKHTLAVGNFTVTARVPEAA